MISFTNFIDFSEIADGYAFTQFAADFLKAEGLYVRTPAAVGQDGGMDLIAEEPGLYGQGLRWLVSCKHWTRAIPDGEDGARLEKLTQFGCEAFMFVYSSMPSAPLFRSIKEGCERSGKRWHFYSGRDMEKQLLSNPAQLQTMALHLPRQFDQIICQSPREECCGFPEDAQFLVSYVSEHGLLKHRVACRECLVAFENYLEQQGVRYGVICTRQEN